MKYILCAALSILAMGAAYDGLKREFPSATVEGRTRPDGKSMYVFITLPQGNHGNAGADPSKVAADVINRHANGLQLRGRGETGRVRTYEEFAVVDVWDRVGAARVDGTQFIVHVRDGRVLRVIADINTTPLSNDLRKRAKAITPDITRARNAMLDDLMEATGKDPRESRWYNMDPGTFDRIPVDLVVMPDENWIVYKVQYGEYLWWIDAETFATRKRPGGLHKR